MKEHSTKEYTVYEADEDAEYDEEYTIDLSDIKTNSSISTSYQIIHSTIDEVGEVKI